LFSVEVYFSISGHSFISNRVTIEKTLYRLTFFQMRRDNLTGVFYANVSIENALRLHNHDWSLLAKTMAAGKIDFDIAESRLSDFALQCLPNVFGARRNAACPLANQYSAVPVSTETRFFLHHFSLPN
jgi:hypothetical protein